jgi:hypothetical protein
LHAAPIAERSDSKQGKQEPVRKHANPWIRKKFGAVQAALKPIRGVAIFLLTDKNRQPLVAMLSSRCVRQYEIGMMHRVPYLKENDRVSIIAARRYFRQYILEPDQFPTRFDGRPGG